MKFRSFNEEFLISTALLVNVFNDIIIDRRTHGLNRDYSKAISLDEIAKQKIEIPCIIGDRSNILRSLENEQGKYKLPLIILQNASIKTDTIRMVDLHADVFYQQDSCFSKLDPDNPLYRPQQLSKRRGQPIVMEFNMTILTKYKEDLDQILSNWIVHFRPDIYVKWWHPRNKETPLTSQIIWNHNVGFESPVDYDVTKVFTYKASTSFSFKTWLFPGMHSTENAIDPASESIIRKIKFFPNRSSVWDEEDTARGYKDLNDEDSAWVIGDLTSKEDNGQFGFWGVDKAQEFYNEGDDEEGLKSGKYAINNVFNQNYDIISGDPTLSKIKGNSNSGDFFSNYDQLIINKWTKYQAFLNDKRHSKICNGEAFLKPVYFKGGFPDTAFSCYPPSGDYLFKKFFSSYIKDKGLPEEREIKAEFGSSFTDVIPFNLNYDIKTKDLSLIANYNDNDIIFDAKSVYNSETGIYQSFDLKSKPVFNKTIEINLARSVDKNFNRNEDLEVNNYENILMYNDKLTQYNINFDINNNDVRKQMISLISLVRSHLNSINLVEKEEAQYEMIIENTKIGILLKEKQLDSVPFRSFSSAHQEFLDGYYYQILLNHYLYIILKVKADNLDDTDVYDLGPLVPLKFEYLHSPIFEITIPESRLLLGLDINLGI